MTRVPGAPRPPHFLTVTELKLIVPRILHYQCPSCCCEHLTNEQAGPLQRGLLTEKGTSNAVLSGLFTISQQPPAAQLLSVSD